MLNANRGQESTPIHLDPIAFPCIKKPEGVVLCPARPDNVAWQIHAIHCIGKDITQLILILPMPARDRECIQALIHRLMYLQAPQHFVHSGGKPPAPV